MYVTITSLVGKTGTINQVEYGHFVRLQWYAELKYASSFAFCGLP